MAANSPAEVLFYGGAAGGGKTDLCIGLSVTEHRRSMILRREGTQAKGIEERALEILTGHGRYNGSSKTWRIPFFDEMKKRDDFRRLLLGSVKDPGDEQKYQGRPNDFLAFDEITHFLEFQFRFLIGWNRTTTLGQRCRVIAAGNPPFTAEGDWVIPYWGPWLDRQHPNPAKPGDLRYFAMIDGKEREFDNLFPVEDSRGKLIKPRSRTFIPSRVEDNPDLMATDYASTLDALPEPIRTMMREGNFGVAQEDHPWQVIPTNWVLLAQERWKARGGKPPEGKPQTMGVDVARGGKDKTVFSPRWGNFLGTQIIQPGQMTPDGPALVGQLLPHLQTGAKVQIDSIGVGSSPLDILRGLNFDIVQCVGSEGTDALDKSGKIGFANARAQWWWQLREALDPTSGQDLALPDDRELLADLCAPRWILKARGIQIEEKADIKVRIGRSPDKGDSAVYAFANVYVPGSGIFEHYKNEYEQLMAQLGANR